MKALAGFDRNGPKIKTKEILNFVAEEINTGNHLQMRAKIMSTDFNKATDTCNEAINLFEASLQNLCSKQSMIGEESKKVSGQVRKAANELAEGLVRIEKTANFDRLERYVNLLERASAAMQSLAELEKMGKLEKIMQAVK